MTFILPSHERIEIEQMEVKARNDYCDGCYHFKKDREIKTLDEILSKEAKEKYPDQLWMADCSTVEEAITCR